MTVNKQTVYVSLVKEFLCCYLKMEIGTEQFPTEGDLRLYLNKTYRAWWCSVYDSLEEPAGYDFRPPTVYTEEEFVQAIKDKGLWPGHCNYQDMYNRKEAVCG